MPYYTTSAARLIDNLKQEQWNTTEIDKKTYNSKHSPSAVNEFGFLVSLQILRDLTQSKWVEPKVTATHQPNRLISKNAHKITPAV